MAEKLAILRKNGGGMKGYIQTIAINLRNTTASWSRIDVRAFTLDKDSNVATYNSPVVSWQNVSGTYKLIFNRAYKGQVVLFYDNLTNITMSVSNVDAQAGDVFYTRQSVNELRIWQFFEKQ